MLLAMIEVFFMWIILWIVFTQIIYPISKNTILFPMFRNRRRLEKEIEIVNEKLEEVSLKNEIKIKNERIKKGEIK
jgi:hypothetical protein